jgi:hypothetical protein
MTEAPEEEQRRSWRRRFAAEANNRGWALAEQGTRTAREDAEMLDAAHASAFLWSAIGTSRNEALADLLLAQVHALLGHGASAQGHAQRALAHFSAHDGQPWELAFAHAVLAHAAHARGLPPLHREHWQQAVAAAGGITNDEERRIFDATFRTIPHPPAA